MAHATSVRLEDGIYAEIKEISRRRGVTMNAFIARALQQEIARARYQEMYEAATLLGQDKDSDVDFAFDTQSEIVMKED